MINNYKGEDGSISGLLFEAFEHTYVWAFHHYYESAALLLAFINDNQATLPPQFKLLLNPTYQKNLHFDTTQDQGESDLDIVTKSMEEINFSTLTAADKLKAISLFKEMNKMADLSHTDVAKILVKEFGESGAGRSP